MMANMLKDIEVKTNVDYFKDKYELDSLAKKIVFTGNIDQFFDYRFGHLEYRSLKFETSLIETPFYQGSAVVNYTRFEIPFTRILEHKYFEFGKSANTVITKEYPAAWSRNKQSYYPICDYINNEKYQLYKKFAMATCPNVVFGGRLAEYKYYDMHQVIGSALAKSKSILQSVQSA